jgi:CRP-like cAMP-binding protein
MHQARIAALQGMPIFGGLRAEVLAALLAGSRTVVVPRDAFFFHEGDKADAVYVLERGAVALLDLFPRSASVQAIKACTAPALSATGLYTLYETDDAQFALVPMNIAREVSRRVRAADERLFRARVGALRPEPQPGPPPF